MPALKTNQFNSELVENSKIGRALAHPARLRIIQLIIHQGYVRNVDLLRVLKLSKSSVSNHIIKLKEASIIETSFVSNSYYDIALTPGADEMVRDFIHDLFEY